MSRESAFIKKNFNINSEYVEEMKMIIPSRKQTEFVNRAIKHELERERERLDRSQALATLSKLKKFRNQLPKSSEASEDILRKMRDSRGDE